MTNKKLVSVDLIMENMEIFRVPVEMVYKLSIENIKRSCGIHINGYVHNGYSCGECGEEWEMISSDNIVISLNREGLKNLKDFNNFNTLEERLQKYNDLCQIVYNYDDGSDKQFIVTWDEHDSNETSNGYQHNIFTRNTINIIVTSYDNEEFLKWIVDDLDWGFEFDSLTPEDVELNEVEDE